MAALPDTVGRFVADDFLRRLDATLQEAGRPQPEREASAGWLRDSLQRLIDGGLDQLPAPGGGCTLERWQALARVAAHDLSLVKWYESHTDALAILTEIEPRRALPRRRSHAVWASEGGAEPLRVTETAAGAVVDGRKRWCSGAEVVQTGLMTAVDARDRRVLVEISLAGPGIRVDRSGWHAVGMRDSGSFDIVCRSVPARQVGEADAYLARPGFWHGGIGVAACWYGAAAAIGSRVRDLQIGRDDVHALAHLGAIDGALAAARAVLRECAETIDREPARDMARVALRARGLVADLAESVVHHAGRAIGPGPLCNEQDLARRVADLTIFMRQSRAEHDRVAQARALLSDVEGMCVAGWSL